VARESVSLDHLSNGRLILGVGLGFPADAEFEHFGEEGDGRIRAQKLDEGLEILEGLWSATPFSYSGRYYELGEDTFLPAPVQQPRIPIWVAATWPNVPPLRRAVRWDGVFVIDARGIALDLDSLKQAVGKLRSLGAGDGFEIVAHYAGGDAAAYEEAGATWLIDGPGPDEGMEELSRLIQEGPRRA
jgi:Luciferase-like monooxygenase